MTDQEYMKIALQEAAKAYEEREIPIGAVLVSGDNIIAKAHNYREQGLDATAHAELMVIQDACKKLGRWRLSDCTLYVTIEPCPMCAGAIVNSRIKRVVYGSDDPKGGAVESLFNVLSHPKLNHQPEVVSGVCQEECSQIMKDFFKMRREEKKALKKQQKALEQLKTSL